MSAAAVLLTADGTTPSAAGIELVRRYAKAVLAGDFGKQDAIRGELADATLAPLRHILDDLTGDLGFARYLLGS